MCFAKPSQTNHDMCNISNNGPTAVRTRVRRDSNPGSNRGWPIIQVVAELKVVTSNKLCEPIL